MERTFLTSDTFILLFLSALRLLQASLQAILAIRYNIRPFFTLFLLDVKVHNGIIVSDHLTSNSVTRSDNCFYLSCQLLLRGHGVLHVPLMHDAPFLLLQFLCQTPCRSLNPLLTDGLVISKFSQPQ